MPALKNPRHELFAQELATGKTADEAYASAGYKPNRGNAARLNANESIRERVTEILERGAARAEVTIEKIVAELAKIGFANMADYMRASGDGDPYLDFSQLTREQAAALQEVTVEDFKEGRGEDARDVRRIKFKLCDKRAALVDLGKHLGMFPNKIEVGNKPGETFKTEEVSAAERIRSRVASLAARVGAGENPS
jgi:phage terminase small subunit